MNETEHELTILSTGPQLPRGILYCSLYFCVYLKFHRKWNLKQENQKTSGLGAEKENVGGDEEKQLSFFWKGEVFEATERTTVLRLKIRRHLKGQVNT